MLPFFSDPSKRKLVIGIIGGVLLTVAAGLWGLVADPGPMAQESMAACLRIGLLMGIVWLAYEQLVLIPAWLWWSFPLVILLLALRPRWLPYLIPILIALAFLRPRPPRRKGGPR
jgi:hypothetical protein